jgi:hypothetical protein
MIKKLSTPFNNLRGITLFLFMDYCYFINNLKKSKVIFLLLEDI